MVHCQKCGKDRERHDTWTCQECRLTVCSSCLEYNATIYAPTLCRECAAIRRAREWEAAKERLARAKENMKKGI